MKVYHSFGHYTVQKLGSFILVPDLQVGGAIQIMDNQAYVLDDGYVIKRKKENKESFNNLLKQATKLTKLAPSSNQIALLEAHISLALLQERENVINKWNVLCK